MSMLIRYLNQRWPRLHKTLDTKGNISYFGLFYQPTYINEATNIPVAHHYAEHSEFHGPTSSCCSRGVWGGWFMGWISTNKRSCSVTTTYLGWGKSFNHSNISSKINKRDNWSVNEIAQYFIIQCYILHWDIQSPTQKWFTYEVYLIVEDDRRAGESTYINKIHFGIIICSCE